MERFDSWVSALNGLLDAAGQEVNQGWFADERWIEPVARRVLNLYTMM